MKSLFRLQAMEHQKETYLGDVMIAKSISLRWYTLLIVIIALIIGNILFFSEYSRKQSVQGYLSPNPGLVKIYAPRSGVYREVHVSEKQFVVKDQLLATVIDKRDLDTGTDVDAGILEQLTLQQQAVHDSIARTQQIDRLQQRSYVGKIAALQQEMQSLREQRKTQQARLALAQAEFDRQKQLVKNKLIAAAAHNQQRDKLLQQESQTQQLQQLLVAKQNELKNIAVEQSLAVEQSFEKIAQFETKLSEIQQQRLRIKGDRSFTIRAPHAGYVSALQAHAGAAVSTQHPLLTLVPDGFEMQAYLYVPTKAIGFISPGQSVRIQYDAFPFQRFGTYQGTVVEITSTILSPTDIAGPVPVSLPVYRVVVSLGAQHILAYGKQIDLQPDMTLRADVIYDTRNLLDWLLEPIASLRGQPS